jgi:hypothetical protein
MNALSTQKGLAKNHRDEKCVLAISSDQVSDVLAS